MLEIKQAILQTGAGGETIKVFSRIELPASLSDKEAVSCWRGAGPEPEKCNMSANNQPATMKGPAIFLAQFAGDAQPFNSSMPSAAGRRGSATRACRFRPGIHACSTSTRRPTPGLLRRGHRRGRSHGLAITELSTHLQGQLVAVHPAYDEAFDGFAPPASGAIRRRGRHGRSTDDAGRAGLPPLGLTGSVTFSGALAWPYLYPWPQRPAGLIETAFDELARRWRPILDAFDEAGVDLCYEIHPGEDSATA